MTRDELEAVTRRALTDVTMATMRDRVPTAALNLAADAILAAADAYAVTTGGITAERRAAISGPQTVRERRAATGAVHWLDGDELPACRPRAKSARCGTDTREITCQRCQETVSFRAAAGFAVMA